MPYSKGIERERELVNLLERWGFAATRVPGSGGGTKRDLPDVVAGMRRGRDEHRLYAIEAKASGGDPIYLDGDEAESLVYFARRFGARARVGVRFDREEWAFFHPGDLYVTDGGNYRVKRETAIVEGLGLEQLAGSG